MKWPVILVRKPTTIEAMRWTGDNFCELRSWGAPVTFMGDERDEPNPPLWLWVSANNAQLRLEEGEWIAKDEIGFYPIKNEMIEKNYTPMQQDPHA